MAALSSTEPPGMHPEHEGPYQTANFVALLSTSKNAVRHGASLSHPSQLIILFKLVWSEEGMTETG